MAPLARFHAEPIPISRIGGRYLLFDIDVVTHLRRLHNICGVLIGGIPQVPQQNVFLGLPVELLPEEALLLVEKQIAFVVDESDWHKDRFNTFCGNEKQQYLGSLRDEGRKAQKSANKGAQKRAERGLAKQAIMKASRSKDEGVSGSSEGQVVESILFDGIDIDRSSSPSLTSSSTSMKSMTFTVTPTTTCSISSISQHSSPHKYPSVSLAYPLYAHLHARDYFITPGLRFGCDYTVYPGDPLRFHSHFIAVGYEWEQEIPLVDLIGGGRLGTGVKKGFLAGGRDPSIVGRKSGEDVRTFCIEWGGM